MQVDIFTEEIIRAGSAASLSVLLNRLDPTLRETANLGRLLSLTFCKEINVLVIIHLDIAKYMK